MQHCGQESELIDTRPFMCGVCEGFYGKPWSLTQRLRLFERMQRFGMNTYLYAPKDDYKHRLDWRELYNSDESDELRQLIMAAKECQINFVYALSPGLDIIFTSPTDLRALKDKLSQVKEMGCKYFALLFDDIDDELSFEDKLLYSSPAEAQASLTNTIYHFLNQPDILMFCPTEYSTNRTEPDLTSNYLKTIGEKLHSNIDVLWTGPKVVSQYITVDNISTVSQILQRRLTIWDNLHANDYDQTRLFLGPYSGRDYQLRTHLRGVLTNPNCEFEANFIAMHTLAQWGAGKCTRFLPAGSSPFESSVDNNSTMKMDVDGDSTPNVDRGPASIAIDTTANGTPSTLADGSEHASENDGKGAAVHMESDHHQQQQSPTETYNERRALNMAVLDWLPELYKTITSSGKLYATDQQGSGSIGGKSDVTVRLEDVTSETADKVENIPTAIVAQTSDGQSSKSRRRRHSNDSINKLTADDMILICHLFYLPYEHGPRASVLLQSARWLLSHNPPPLPSFEAMVSTGGNSSSSDSEDDARYEWYHRAGQFHRQYRDIAIVVDKLVNIPNRELLYELYAYMTDMRSTLALLNSYVKWHGTEKKLKETEFKSGDQEPWVYRGGILGEFRALLPLDNRQWCASPSSQSLSSVFVRPYFPDDKEIVYSICASSFRGMKSPTCKIYPQLAADWYVGGLLEYEGSKCFVLEDGNSAVCGYVIACLDACRYYKHFINTWLPTLRQIYPLTDNDDVKQDLVFDAHHTAPSVPDEVTSVYPSMISCGISSESATVSGSYLLSLLKCACKHLRALHSRGVYAVLQPGLNAPPESTSFKDITSLWPALTDRFIDNKVIGQQLV